MAGITLAIAQAKLTEWLDAETAIAGGQEYEIGSRRLRRADLEYVRESITYWDTKCTKLGRSGGTGNIRVQLVVPK